MKYSIEKIKGSKLNPKNWGVLDYSDKYKTQGEAYKNAQDKSEFLYNGVRIKKDIASDNRNSAYLQNKNYWREYKNYLSENFPDEVEKRYNDALDLHYRYGNPKINLLSDDDAKSGNYQTSYSEFLQSGRSNFTLDNTINIFYNKAGKFDREVMFDNYKQEMLHARQLKDKGFNNFVEHQREDFKRNNISAGDKQDYDKKMYSDLKSIEGVHILETEGINARYNRDYELEENPDYKHERLYILNKYRTDDFHPYQNQGDLRVIQKALSEQGYKLPKSTKQDGSFDGIWGDETKNALSDYQINNYEEGGKLNNHTNINMKYNKEKTKKFTKGGKTPKEIKEEATSSAIARDAANTATRDAVYNRGIPAYQSQPVIIQAHRPTVDLTLPELTQKSDLKSMFKTRGEAFNYARKQGWTDFTWGGGRFHTKTAEEEAKAVKAATSKNNTSTAQQTASDPLFYIKRNEEQQPAQIPAPPRQEGSRAHGFGKTGWYPSTRSFFDVKTTTGSGHYGWDMPDGTFRPNRSENFIINAQHVPKINRTIVTSRDPERRAPLERREIVGEDTTYYDHRGKLIKDPSKYVSNLDKYFQVIPFRLTPEEKEQNRLLAIPHGEGLPAYQQGGQIPKFQQGGGILDRIKQKLSERFTDPNRHQVNNVSTTYKQRTPFIGVPTETRSITGANGQTSKMVIRRPGTERADTTFYSPGGAKNPDLYPPFTPQDIREGNRKGKGNESFMQKFTSPDYFPHLRKHQQGGTIDNEESGATDQLYVDFAIRYLKAKGVSEDNMVDNEGGLRDEFVEEVTTAINEVDSADFWEQYQANPDAIVQSYIESKMEPGQIEMARKGAKLKKLKKGGMKSRKCKCGCNLTMKKEAGGKIKEVCACGCKK